ncbi:transposase [Deinococcus sp. HMF7604]|uniref:transposase n=1 Tax=Deinococcus betulae TaxID=2873312 RepID=UPI001CCD071A|nr:transposase [Deinococcus betulae]MBZ9752874.1 transposase [Deinococcus betulae]
MVPHIDPRWREWYDHRIESYRFPKGEAARLAYVLQIGQDGFTLLDALDTDLNAAHLAQLPAIQQLRLVWFQQFMRTDGVVQWRPGTAEPPSAQRSESPYDPEARYSIKRGRAWLGYKLHLTETCDPALPHLITHVQVTAACVQDIDALPAVHQALERKVLLPTRHLVDSGYVSGSLMAQSLKDFAVELIGPPRASSSWQQQDPHAFKINEFVIHWDEHFAVCPRGHRSSKWQTGRSKQGLPTTTISFRSGLCNRCPEKTRCTQSTRRGRSFTVQDQAGYEALGHMRSQQETDAWKVMYHRRAGIEGTIAVAVRAYQARTARYRGEAKVRVQGMATAASINLERVFAWWLERPRATTRTARFARLPLSA